MFHFSLQPLLTHRKFKEKLLKKELAESKKHVAEAKTQLALYEQRTSDLIRDLHARTSGKTAASQLQMYSLSHERLASQVDYQRAKVKTEEQAEQKKRLRLIDAMQKRKVVDRLREKRWERYRAEMAKKEESFNNEVAVQRFNRKT